MTSICIKPLALREAMTNCQRWRESARSLGSFDQVFARHRTGGVGTAVHTRERVSRERITTTSIAIPRANRHGIDIVPSSLRPKSGATSSGSHPTRKAAESDLEDSMDLNRCYERTLPAELLYANLLSAPAGRCASAFSLLSAHARG